MCERALRSIGGGGGDKFSIWVIEENHRQQISVEVFRPVWLLFLLRLFLLMEDSELVLSQASNFLFFSVPGSKNRGEATSRTTATRWSSCAARATRATG